MNRNHIMENLRAYYPKKPFEFWNRLATPIYEGRYQELFEYICEENKKHKKHYEGGYEHLIGDLSKLNENYYVSGKSLEEEFKLKPISKPNFFGWKYKGSK